MRQGYSPFLSTSTRGLNPNPYNNHHNNHPKYLQQHENQQQPSQSNIINKTYKNNNKSSNTVNNQLFQNQQALLSRIDNTNKISSDTMDDKLKNKGTFMYHGKYFITDRNRWNNMNSVFKSMRDRFGNKMEEHVNIGEDGIQQSRLTSSFMQNQRMTNTRNGSNHSNNSKSNNSNSSQGKYYIKQPKILKQSFNNNKNNNPKFKRISTQKSQTTSTNNNNNKSTIKTRKQHNTSTIPRSKSQFKFTEQPAKVFAVDENKKYKLNGQFFRKMQWINFLTHNQDFNQDIPLSNNKLITSHHNKSTSKITTPKLKTLLNSKNITNYNNSITNNKNINNQRLIGGGIRRSKTVQSIQLQNNNQPIKRFKQQYNITVSKFKRIRTMDSKYNQKNKSYNNLQNKFNSIVKKHNQNCNNSDCHQGNNISNLGRDNSRLLLSQKNIKNINKNNGNRQSVDKINIKRHSGILLTFKNNKLNIINRTKQKCDKISQIIKQKNQYKSLGPGEYNSNSFVKCIDAKKTTKYQFFGSSSIRFRKVNQNNKNKKYNNNNNNNNDNDNTCYKENRTIQPKIQYQRAQKILHNKYASLYKQSKIDEIRQSYTKRSNITNNNS